MFKTDTGGMAVTADIKISRAATTWNTRLSQIGRFPGKVTICTFSLCDLDYIGKILSKRDSDLTIICNSKYEYNARRLKEMFPYVDMYISPNCHAKLALIEPGTVWVSSENLGKKKNTFDTSIGIHSVEAYNHYLAQVESLLRSRNTTCIDDDYINATAGRLYFKTKEAYTHA